MPIDHELQVEELLRSLTEAIVSERRAAIRTVVRSRIIDERIIKALVELLRTSELSLREQTALALARIGRPAVDTLLAALSDEDDDFRKAVVVTLGLMGPDAAAAQEPLSALVEHEHLGPWAVRALYSIRAPSPWQRRLRRAWPWTVVSALVLVVGLCVRLLVDAATQDPLWRLALPAATALGFLGVYLGLIVGRHVAGTRRALLLAAFFGLGGASAGWLMSWIVLALVTPVTRVLGP